MCNKVYFVKKVCTFSLVISSSRILIDPIWNLPLKGNKIIVMNNGEKVLFIIFLYLQYFINLPGCISPRLGTKPKAYQAATLGL